MKNNLKKAYNRLEWSFLKTVMQALGFKEKFRDLVQSCIGTVTSSILLNDSVIGTIKPMRGLRQRDPISPLLFLLCSETLSRLLGKEETMGNIHVIKVSHGARAITHLMYADDLVVCFRAGSKDA